MVAQSREMLVVDSLTAWRASNAVAELTNGRSINSRKSWLNWQRFARSSRR